MSLYYEAEAVLANAQGSGGSLKSRIYKRGDDAKSSPAQLFALISSASKWSPVLKGVVEACGLLAAEKKVRETFFPCHYYTVREEERRGDMADGIAVDAHAGAASRARSAPYEERRRCAGEPSAQARCAAA